MLGLQLPRHSESCEGNAGRIMLPDKSYLFAGSLFGIPLLPLVASVMGILGIGRTYGSNCP